MTDQEKRKFVERVDFISSPGFLDGSEGARERAGLPPDTGPYPRRHAVGDVRLHARTQAAPDRRRAVGDRR